MAIVTDDAQRDLGTTFVTMGSSGPKFYENDPQWWDDIVYDDDTQTGLVLEAAGDELQARVYTIGGELVDEFAVDEAGRAAAGDLARGGRRRTERGRNAQHRLALQKERRSWPPRTTSTSETLLDVRTTTSRSIIAGSNRSPHRIAVAGGSDSTVRVYVMGRPRLRGAHCCLRRW